MGNTTEIPAIDIVRAETDEAIAHVRGLMRAFLSWLRTRYGDRSWQVDNYYQADDLERELASLPGEYAPPGGCLLLALDGGEPAGCVSYKRLDEGVCEMKRLFVQPAYHGRGIGKSLTRALIDEARVVGYGVMRLETGDLQPEAISLYRSMGFRGIAPYHQPPPGLEDTLVFMELDLGTPQ